MTVTEGRCPGPWDTARRARASARDQTRGHPDRAHRGRLSPRTAHARFPPDRRRAGGPVPAAHGRGGRPPIWFSWVRVLEPSQRKRPRTAPLLVLRELLKCRLTSVRFPSKAEMAPCLPAPVGSPPAAADLGTGAQPRAQRAAEGARPSQKPAAGLSGFIARSALPPHLSAGNRSASIPPLLPTPNPR